ncbi:MAG TPA: acyl-CoA dehydrogenase [Acetobacteraceae bacterium]|jgi:alkylation response protein AidB-like acyl-CoA dehydrogenase|nr:acyl-CoA dehydrogenase [Acetobacteraceae bacterium]
MNFDFIEDQYLLRDSVRAFLADHWDTKKLRAAGGRFSADLWQGLTGLGLQTLLVPEQHDGSGLGLVDSVLAFEEFGRALVPGPVRDTILISEVIARFGTPAQCAALLPAIAAGTARVAFAHAEPGAGHRTEPTGVTATSDGSAWRLHGRKILVPAADAATVLAISARLPDGRAALFLCDLPAQGVTLTRNIAVDADSMPCRVDLNAAPAAVLGVDALSRLLETSAIAAAAEMIGIAGAALDLAVAYAKQRTQFDRPIGSFQAIKHRCADMLVALEAARPSAYYAAWAATEDAPDQPLAVSVAKAAAGDACRFVCNECLQIHGGVGFTWEFDVHLYMKRGKFLEYSFGDATWHRERVAALVLPARAA